MMPAVAAAAVVLAFVLDLLVAEFPERIHPVALFGRLVSPFDRPWSHPRAVGAIVALGLPLVAAGLLGGLVALAMRLHPVAGAIVAGLVLFSTISLRMLVSVAREVIDLTGSDVDRARTEVRSLVGRDASTLSPAELRSAAVESVAENLADGLVAPLLAFVVGARVSLAVAAGDTHLSIAVAADATPFSIAVAAGGAAWVKGVDTLDSMFGYESKPFGWASARLDDVAMWLPARLAAGLIAIAALDPGAVVRARTWARAPPSPNSGWPMATLAAVLDVRLAKPGVYTLNPAGGLPTADRARRGVRIVGIAGVLAAAVAGVVAWS